jgi:hypothetical protein
MFARYARRLPTFLRAPMTLEEARRRVAQGLRDREQSFLALLEGGVYARHDSPYRQLLGAAGAELGDVRNLVGELGLETALERLRAAGVYLTFDEFKGRRPVQRSGISLRIDESSLDNPLATPHYRAFTGGSRARRRVSIDLGLLEQEAAYHSLFRATFDLWDRPLALWGVIPPSSASLNNCLRQLKTGGAVERWFNPHAPPRDAEALKSSLLVRYTTAAARACGAKMRAPEHCPPEEAGRVAGWLAAKRRDGRAAVLDTSPSLGVRVCRAAVDTGLDISGSFLRFGGEPYTEAKAAAVAQAGASAVCHYSMTETGRIGLACGTPAALDDVHVVTDKVAVLQRRRVLDETGISVGALYCTTITGRSRKLMINVETDDYGVLEKRQCGCPLGELGLSTHLHGIRSYEKLTSEGNHFLGADLIALVDEVLPSRFGGGPTDYQLVEEEVDGLPKVTVVIRPQIGEVQETEVLATVAGFLRSQPRNRLMAMVWEEGDTLRVARREPSLTAAAKILPLHLTRGG